MKRKIAVAVIAATMLLSGCASSDTTDTAEPISSNDEVSVEAEASAEDELSVESEVDDELFTYFYELIQEDAFEDFNTEFDNTLAGIGVQSISELTYENLAYVGTSDTDLSLDFIATTEAKTLRVKTLYMNLIDAWSISSIQDYDSNHYYWCADSIKDYYDIYDYETDTLVSEKTKDYSDSSADDAVSNFEEESEEISQEFEDSLDELREKYGLSE